MAFYQITNLMLYLCAKMKKSVNSNVSDQNLRIDKKNKRDFEMKRRFPEFYSR